MQVIAFALVHGAEERDLGREHAGHLADQGVEECGGVRRSAVMATRLIWMIWVIWGLAWQDLK